MGIYANSISENITTSSATGGVTGIWLHNDFLYGTGGDDNIITSISYMNGSTAISDPSTIANSNCQVSTKYFATFLGSYGTA